MAHFLLVYNRLSGRLDSLEEFTDVKDALRERFALERRRVSPDVEVVVLSAESVEDLQLTHARYFNGVETLFAAARETGAA